MHPETGQDKMNKDDYGGKREMISHGKEIKVFYNRYGKIASIRLADE